MIVLGDGTFGMLPEEWISGTACWASWAPPTASGFASAGAGGPAGRAARRRAAGFGRRRLRQGAQRAEPLHRRRARPSAPARFRGALRRYQEAGSAGCPSCAFGFGGCLADDMGLGKTVQVLALLAARDGHDKAADRRSWSCRSRWSSTGAGGGALRAAPARLDHAGPEPRHERRAISPEYDVVVDDLRHAPQRRRAARASIEFDYVILDEAQAIKNADSRVGQGRRGCSRGRTASR